MINMIQQKGCLLQVSLKLQIKQHISVTCFSSFETYSRYFLFSFTVVDFKKILSEQHSLRKVFRNLSFNILPWISITLPIRNTHFFWPHWLKKKIFFSFIYQIISIRPALKKPNAIQTYHFPINRTKP